MVDDLLVINLPMIDDTQIERTAYEIDRELRKGRTIPAEALDWLDWANTHLNESN